MNKKLELRFNEEGRFRALLLSDAHHAPDTGDRTIEAMELLIDRTKPDFVFLLGDNIAGHSTEEQCRLLIDQIGNPMESRNLPWAHVFGNHDSTPLLSKSFQQGLYEKHPHCLSQAGPKDIPGIGNYFLPIVGKDDEPMFGIWALDSQQDLKNQTSKLDYDGDLYWDLLMPSRLASNSDSDFIRFEQVMWYFSQSKALESRYKRKIPSMMLFHIPLAEFNAIVNNASRTHMKGEYNEKVSASEVNSGLFAAALQRGDVKAMFCGHDHINTFDGTYCGIHMGYDGSTGYHGYGARDNDPGKDRERLRGGRIIDIDAARPWEPKAEMVFVKDLFC